MWRKPAQRLRTALDVEKINYFLTFKSSKKILFFFFFLSAVGFHLNVIHWTMLAFFVCFLFFFFSGIFLTYTLKIWALAWYLFILSDFYWELWKSSLQMLTKTTVQNSVLSCKKQNKEYACWTLLLKYSSGYIIIGILLRLKLSPFFLFFCSLLSLIT